MRGGYFCAGHVTICIFVQEVNTDQTVKVDVNLRSIGNLYSPQKQLPENIARALDDN